MLSANKVKLHGLKDDRWVVKDKITQYKGLINLFGKHKGTKLFKEVFI